MFSRGSVNEYLVSEAVSDAVVRTDKLSDLWSFWKHKPASPGANDIQAEAPEGPNHVQSIDDLEERLDDFKRMAERHAKTIEDLEKQLVRYTQATDKMREILESIQNTVPELDKRIQKILDAVDVLLIYRA